MASPRASTIVFLMLILGLAAALATLYMQASTRIDSLQDELNASRLDREGLTAKVCHPLSRPCLILQCRDGYRHSPSMAVLRPELQGRKDELHCVCGGQRRLRSRKIGPKTCMGRASRILWPMARNCDVR